MTIGDPSHASGPPHAPHTGGPRITRSASKVLVSGAKRKLPRVERALRVLRARIEQVDWDELLGRRREAGVLAQIIVAPLPDASLRQLAARPALASLATAAPTIVLVDRRTSERDVRALYRVGVTTVVNWPREERRLGELLAELLGIARVRGRVSRVHVALTRTIRARLRLFGGTTPGLRISVDRGVARLSGSVLSLERKREVERTVSRVPGIVSTDTTGLNVTPLRMVPDRRMRDAVDAVLRAVTEGRHPTVTAVVRRGTSSYAGLLEAAASFIGWKSSRVESTACAASRAQWTSCALARVRNVSYRLGCRLDWGRSCRAPQ